MADEIIFTLASGVIELAFADGHHATILASEPYLIGSEAIIANSPSVTEATITVTG